MHLTKAWNFITIYQLDNVKRKATRKFAKKRVTLLTSSFAMNFNETTLGEGLIKSFRLHAQSTGDFVT